MTICFSVRRRGRRFFLCGKLISTCCQVNLFILNFCTEIFPVFFSAEKYFFIVELARLFAFFISNQAKIFISKHHSENQITKLYTSHFQILHNQKEFQNDIFIKYPHLCFNLYIEPQFTSYGFSLVKKCYIGEKTRGS